MDNLISMTPQKTTAQSTDLAIEELGPLLAKGQRLLGLDLGTKTIGLALSDSMRIVATPMQTLAKGKFREDAQRL